jgi:hypothetical protein
VTARDDIFRHHAVRADDEVAGLGVLVVEQSLVDEHADAGAYQAPVDIGTLLGADVVAERNHCNS